MNKEKFRQNVELVSNVLEGIVSPEMHTVITAGCIAATAIDIIKMDISPATGVYVAAAVGGIERVTRSVRNYFRQQ
jgi:hypothetical protein